MSKSKISNSKTTFFKINTKSHPIPDQEYNQRLTEIAEIIYSTLCQQSKSKEFSTCTGTLTQKEKVRRESRKL